MSSAIRKLERNAVKNKLKKNGESVGKGFQSAWQSYREEKYITKDNEGNVIEDNTPRNTMRKKQRHFDNIEQYTNLFAYWDALNAEREEKAVAGK